MTYKSFFKDGILALVGTSLRQDEVSSVIGNIYPVSNDPNVRPVNYKWIGTGKGAFDDEVKPFTLLALEVPSDTTADQIHVLFVGSGERPACTNPTRPTVPRDGNMFASTPSLTNTATRTLPAQ